MAELEIDEEARREILAEFGLCECQDDYGCEHNSQEAESDE